MSISHTAEPRAMHGAIVLAGLAGAMAEVIWIALYSAISPLSGGEVLRQITASIFPAMAESILAPALGVLLHVVLGVAVAYAFGVLIWQTYTRRMGAGTTLATALVALAAIWTFNFFVLLPVINAEFIGLMPYAVTFISKALFALAMAATLNSFAPVSDAGANGPSVAGWSPRGVERRRFRRRMNDVMQTQNPTQN
jgi:hypothetical protein